MAGLQQPVGLRRLAYAVRAHGRSVTDDLVAWLAVPVLVIGRDAVLRSGTGIASILRPMGGLRWFPGGIRAFTGRARTVANRNARPVRPIRRNQLATREAVKARQDEIQRRGLGWVSLGLGVAQLAAPDPMRRISGVDDSPTSRTVVPLVGVRELVHAAGLLTSRIVSSVSLVPSSGSRWWTC